MSKPLSFNLVQAEIIWEDRTANLAHYESLFEKVSDGSHIIVLPEMFDTGFTNNAVALAETMDGATVNWMKAQSQKLKKIICGSTIIEEEGKYYNRFIWMLPNGEFHYYDKKHLFGKANEDEFYTAGDKRVIVQVNGWRILLQTCYDLRFPTWARQQKELYDVILYVANWPAKRIEAWNALLKARAIENQCYVIGVNRVGNDGNDIYYNGNSAVYNPEGICKWILEDEEAVGVQNIGKEIIEEVRTSLPFLQDRDGFMLLD